jgi:hypothetical protein
MNTRVVVQFVCFAVIFLAIGYHLARAIPPDNAAQPPAQESLDVRYARAQVILAEANLKRLQEMNQKVSGAVSADMLISYQEDLKTAQTELAAARAGNAGQAFEVWLRRAAAALAYADVQWRAAVAANQRMAGTVSPIDVERRRLRLEVDRLELERGQALAQGSAEQKLAWELSVMSNEMQRLKEEVRQTVPATPLYPSWWRY